MDEGDGDTGASSLATAIRVPPPSHTPPMPIREDCWSEEATYTLVEAWGERFLELNRGNLRQKHWQEVADAVNADHGHTKKARRTDVQCKNRIDTLKKKYKIEKARVSESAGSYLSPWTFYARLDELIGSSYKPSPSSAPVPSRRKSSPATIVLPPLATFPVGPRSKRPVPTILPAVVDNFRRNFSAIAAAAAATDAGEDSDTSRSRSSAASRKRKGDGDGLEGLLPLARAIEKFGQIYERVEDSKQRQLIELEKQRMQFAKDLEIQRMKLYMDSQIHLEKMKRAKRTPEADDEEYL
ncbi:trihelix transcription factor ASIL2-like [Impatiens glandulifera]|uniref:trihelix transcription factor ASIL2-like n=1 Tax=Impatiens glandulifera TaxID=253017 RepID=UPI001FB14033|nr:trihelix transcription factor ASIL2-like [Impatiens glandulifera]